MSYLSSNELKLGESATASQNFKVTTSNDGTLTIARADGSQTVLSVDASGVVTATQGIVSNRMVLGTAIATTSGTTHDFTGIPSWVKRITVMLNGVSTNGVSGLLIQIGSSTITTTGYLSSASGISSVVSTVSNTTGFRIYQTQAVEIVSGCMTLLSTNPSTNLWVSSHTVKLSSSANAVGGGDVTLSGTLDRIRLTTVNGTDTFDAGSVNIMYEG